MNDVNFNALRDENDIIESLNQTTENINEYISARNIGMFNLCWNTVMKALECWAGNTYVGDKKQKNIEAAFQNFFLSLRELLLAMKNNAVSNMEKEIAEKAFFTGTIFRYLGHNSPGEKNRVDPEYNDIYVSWSKNPTNSYIETKLYGTQTLMTCEIKPPFWGIDLEGLGVSHGNEKEVVFPTVKELITDIKYIEDDDECVNWMNL